MTVDFFEAVRAGNQAAVEAALGADAGLLQARDEKGRSPVVVAAYAGHPRLAERLADRIGTADLGYFEAAMAGDAGAVRRHLDDNSEIGDTSDDGYTTLHFAAWFGRLEVARLLLGRGADPNTVAANESRVTPLHSAVAGRHRDVATLLLAHGASPNVIQKGGFMPLHSAAANGDEAIVDMLLLRGADPTRPADDGRTAIDLAVSNGHGALAELLRESVSDRFQPKRKP
jgi:ankyrin repeat protein